jgi:hypothetical protein
MWYENQTTYDEIVEAMILYSVKLADKVLMLKRQRDPDVIRREEELILLSNCIYTLNHYDITSEVLTDEEIEHAYELSTIILQGCGL